MNIINFLQKIYLRFTWTFWPIWRLKKSGATLGEKVFIGEHCYVELENAKHLTIESGVVLAAFCKIILHDSSLNNINGFDLFYGKVVLRKNCYLGADVLVLPGSEVGENTIVGAGSLVKGKLKPNSVYVGRPAKYLCSVDEQTEKWTKNKELKIGNEFSFIGKKSPYRVG